MSSFLASLNGIPNEILKKHLNGKIPWTNIKRITPIEKFQSFFRRNIFVFFPSKYFYLFSVVLFSYFWILWFQVLKFWKKLKFCNQNVIFQILTGAMYYKIIIPLYDVKNQNSNSNIPTPKFQLQNFQPIKVLKSDKIKIRYLNIYFNINFNIYF